MEIVIYCSQQTPTCEHFISKSGKDSKSYASGLGLNHNLQISQNNSMYTSLFALQTIE